MDKKRFVVLAQPRCGTHLLAGLLRSSRQVYHGGEVFNRASPASHAIAGSMNNIAEYHWNGAPEKIRGFTTFSEHCKRGGLGSGFLEWMPKDVAIVMLFRRDVLAQIVSLEIAMRTGCWERRNSATEPSRIRISLSPSAIQSRASAIFSDRKKLKSVSRHYFEIDFEEIVVRAPELLSFLGGQQADLIPSNLKQEARPLWNVLSNYKELEQHFANSEYGRLFLLQHKEP